LSIRQTADGQPIVNYDARYPTDPANPFYDAAKAGRPILSMLDGNELVHSDINAIIAGPKSNGYRILDRTYPKSYLANQVINMNSGKAPEQFREFTVIFHDEPATTPAFANVYNDPKLQHTLHGVRDGFGINHGSGGMGSEIIANRLGVGPNWDCTDCKYEEMFLTSWALSDSAEVVDVPADAKDAAGNLIVGPKATKVLYPDDPSNVHHSYINDRVKFRNLHAGPKEHHIFHLHTHQWQFTPRTEKSNYLDSQAIGPGQGFTYDIAFGGSGNRNKVVGDAIFHCHFYPHFAQGMWEMWRSHDVFERGAVLGADRRPAVGSRALPDGEIMSGTPIPALVPLPGKPMAPMPDPKTRTVPFDLNGDGLVDSAQVDADGNGVADVAEDWATGRRSGTSR
jgi:hypothetical protein